MGLLTSKGARPSCFVRRRLAMDAVLELGRMSLPFPGATDRAFAAAHLTATIRAAAAGDQEAFSRLYADYVRMVRAILLGRVARGEVDDLVQDVFITAYTRLPELRDAAAFGGWLAAIARN